MTVDQFFARLAEIRVVPELRGVKATYSYYIAGAGEWRVTVDRGSVEVQAGTGASDCTVAADATDFLEIILGRRNTTTALMQGCLRFRGPIVHLLHQAALFRAGARPGPGETDETREEARP
jgi:putative sterol carrier protein